MENKLISLEEWKECILDTNDEKDSNYLKFDTFKNTLSYVQCKDKSIIYTNQFVGILKLPSSKVILSINPKTLVNYLELLSYSQSIHCNDQKCLLYYDSKIRVDIEEGDTFLEVIGALFLIELKRIIKKGLFREYVKKEDNSNYLKGKLMISNQIKTNYICPKFQCRYFDSTIDNFTNEAILFATVKLVNKLRNGNEEIKKIRVGLINCVNLLKDEISIKDSILPSELIKINKSAVIRKTPHYKDIIDLTSMIINQSFYKSIENNTVRCCNFLIDMNVVFERVVFGLLQKILNEKYELSDQKRYRAKNIFTLKSIQLIPDITILKNSSEFGLVDAKYKLSIKNSDYYQTIVYSLVLRSKAQGLKKALLINFREMEDANSMKNGKLKLSELKEEINDVEFYQISLFLNLDSKDYIKSLENQLREIIEKNNIF